MYRMLVLILLLAAGNALAVTRCVKMSGTIVHGGLYHRPTESSYSGADWKNVVDGVSYVGVVMVDANTCYCKIISPIITGWVANGPVWDLETCADDCSTAPNGSLTYNVIQ